MNAQEVFYFCDGAHNKKDVQGWNTLKRVDDSNITTYGREGDGYFRSNLYRQSGNIYIIPDLPTSWLKLS